MQKKLTLIRENDGGVLKTRVYQYGEYRISVVFDGVDRVATVESYGKDILPTLQIEPNANMINFPVQYYLEDADMIIQALRDFQEIKKQLDESEKIE